MSQQPTNILRLPQALSRVGLQKSAFYKAIRDKWMPEPVKLGKRASGWRESDIEAAIAKLTAESPATPTTGPSA